MTVTVKDGDREDVPIEEKVTSIQLNQPSTSDKGCQMGVGVEEIWKAMGVTNVAESMIKLQEAMKNGIIKKVEHKEEPEDVHVNS